MKEVLRRGRRRQKSPISTAISLLALGRRLKGRYRRPICEESARAAPHELNSSENGDHGDN